MTRKLFLVVCLASGLVHALSAGRIAAQPPSPSKQSARSFEPRTVLPKAIRAIVDAPVLPADQVEDQVSANELVLGVVVGGKARAYPINMLTGPRREILNDHLGGRAIAATW